MGTDRQSGTPQPNGFGAVALDLVAIVAATALVAVAVFVPPLSETPVRTVLALVFVFVVPGYALVSALFPARSASNVAGDGTDTDGGWTIDGFARLVLSIGLSVSLVPLLGAVLASSPIGLGLAPYVLGTAAITILAAAVAAVRRWRLPEGERFRVPLSRWAETGRAGVFEAERTDVVLNVALVASILFAAVVFSYAVAAPPNAEEHSTLTLLTEDDGELVTDDYPTDLEPGESDELVVAVENHEDETTDYTVVVVEQEFAADGDESNLTEQHELDRFDIQVADGETEHHTHDLEPTVDSETRIVWLLYTGEPPEDPSTDTADEYVHLWLDGEA